MSRWIQELTWPDVEEYLKRGDTALVPVGATEQHGPHCPIGTDAAEAIATAEEVAGRADALIAAPLWFGWSPHHLAFPGDDIARRGDADARRRGRMQQPRGPRLPAYRDPERAPGREPPAARDCDRKGQEHDGRGHSHRGPRPHRRQGDPRRMREPPGRSRPRVRIGDLLHAV